jgi:hypothetical protein
MKNIILILLLPAIIQAQRHAFPSYLTLNGNDKIQLQRIELNITDKTATISHKNKVLTHRIIKEETNDIETVLTLSCGGKLRLEYINKQLNSFSFSCPGVTLFSSIGFRIY